MLLGLEEVEADVMEGGEEGKSVEDWEMEMGGGS